MKQVIVYGIVVLALAVLIAPAVAAPPTTPKNVAITLALHDGTDARDFDLTSLATAESHCTLVRESGKDQYTEINLCLRLADGGDYQVDVEWKSESHGSSYETRTSALVAAGAPLELGGKTRRLAITVK